MLKCASVNNLSVKLLNYLLFLRLFLDSYLLKTSVEIFWNYDSRNIRFLKLRFRRKYYCPKLDRTIFLLRDFFTTYYVNDESALELQCTSFCVTFIIEINSHSHIKRKQPQIIFLQYNCSVTMINIVKKYMWRKIHALNTLIGSSNDSEPQSQILWKVIWCRITTPLFR